MIIHDKIYGEQEITDPAALEIINTPAMQRLKGVNQYGIWDLFVPEYFTSRFDHCVGVYLLLHKLNASREEQIAGLIHDISHTAFSHVIDYVFGKESSQDVHEGFKHKIVYGSQIPHILEKYGFHTPTILDETKFSLLEQDEPELCADRVDYFLRDSLIVGLHSHEEINEFLSALYVHNGKITMSSEELALKFAFHFIKMGSLLWSPPIQSGSYSLMADILRNALTTGVITKEDFFLTDKEVLHKLQGDPAMAQKLRLISPDFIVVGTEDDFTYHTTAKARYVDPLVVNSSLSGRATDFSPELVEEINNYKERLHQGYYIKIRGEMDNADSI